ncbi:AtzH-like domain-containing protein [Leifsonia sp. AG29]|uniref:AtzH-like domain-containing protein n=1 Tax=Leifsonia sp. AG29 TaxID=2598860 RepID=UPI00131BA787|nr:AtzH-like domain-containing protein [Leifsonia sp. AG29]
MPRPDVVSLDGSAVPDGLVEAALSYEQALADDDVALLDAFFVGGPAVVRTDGDGVLTGQDAIARFRRLRGGAPARELECLDVVVLSAEAAVTVATTSSAGRSAALTQVWRRTPDGWRIAVAHVGAPAVALDERVWRVAGAPLLPPAMPGPLDGMTVAVKDVFAVAGQRLGGGVPAYLAEREPETANATAVQQLVDRGAAVRGVAVTDEFAYSLTGVSPHHAPTPNRLHRGHLPGGSSSGPATAVALGEATIGLATDTAGSIRVPASYQGLWGLRTTHGAVDRAGMLPLAPSFDTAGWLARDGQTLLRVAESVLGAPARTPGPRPSSGAGLVTLGDLGLNEPVAAAFRAVLDRLGPVRRVAYPLDDLAAAFRTVQAAEAWRTHGAWIRTHPGTLSADVAARFDAASRVTTDDETTARASLDAHARRLRNLLGDDVLVLPSTPTTPPPLDIEPAALDSVRAATTRLTSVAGALRAPAVSAPLLGPRGVAGGLCLVGTRGDDVSVVARMLDLAAELEIDRTER